MKVHFLAAVCLPMIVTGGGHGGGHDAGHSEPVAPVAVGNASAPAMFGQPHSDAGHGSSHGSCPSAEHGHHAVPAQSPYAEAEVLTVTLLGAFGFVMLLFYMVKSPAGNFQIRFSTWELIEQMVSIYIAVVFFVCIELEMHMEHATHETETLVMLAVLAACSVVIFGGAFLRRDEISDIMLICHLGEHVLGFAGFFFIGHLQEWYGGLELWKWFACWAVGTLIQFLVTSLCSFGLFRVKTDDVHNEDVEAYVDECEEVVPKSLGFASSGNFVRCLMVAITGCPPHLKEAIGNHTTDERLYLLLVAVGSFLLSCAMSFVKAKNPPKNVDPEDDHEEASEKTLPQLVSRHFLKAFIKMSCAWAVIFWGRWQLYESDFSDALLGRILFALVCSFAGLGFLWGTVISMGCLNFSFYTIKQYTRGVTKVFGFIIGFTWEQTFDMAIETSKETASWKRWVIALGMVAFTLPAFYWYIVPRVIHDKTERQRYIAEVEEEMAALDFLGFGGKFGEEEPETDRDFLYEEESNEEH